MTARERRRHVDNAKDHFLRAAAALTAWEGEPEAFAMFEACRGLMELVAADPEQATRARVETALEAMRS